MASDGPGVLPTAALPALTYLYMSCGWLAGIDQALAEGLLQQHALHHVDIELPPMRLASARFLEGGMHGAIHHVQDFKISFSSTEASHPAHVHHVVRGVAQLSTVTRLHLNVCISR